MFGKTLEPYAKQLVAKEVRGRKGGGGAKGGNSKCGGLEVRRGDTWVEVCKEERRGGHAEGGGQKREKMRKMQAQGEIIQ